MINNYNVYNKRMDKSFQDKLFFLDKIKDNVEAIVDFGCADGALIRHLSELTNIELVGYDSDYNMIDIAKSKTNKDNCLFKEDFGEIIEEEIIPQESLLNISSIIYEVYSLKNWDNSAYTSSDWMKIDEPVHICVDFCKKYKQYDTVLVPVEESISYCKCDCLLLDRLNGELKLC